MHANILNDSLNTKNSPTPTGIPQFLNGQLTITKHLALTHDYHLLRQKHVDTKYISIMAWIAENLYILLKM